MEKLEKENKMPFDYAVITALITIHAAAEKAKQMTDFINQPENVFLKNNIKFKKIWRNIQNGLQNRLFNIFLAKKRGVANQSDLDMLKETCKKSSENIKGSLDILDINVQRYLTFHECSCENAISCMLIVGTLLNHADGIWEFTVCNDFTKTIISNIRPAQEYRHFKEACILSRCLPEDLRYMDDVNIRNCITVLADKIGESAGKYFYKKEFTN